MMNMMFISIFNDDSSILYIIAIMINDSSILYPSIWDSSAWRATPSAHPSKAVAGFPPRRDVENVGD